MVNISTLICFWQERCYNFTLMAEYNKAFVVGGWSESEDFLWGLTNEISNGDSRIVAEAEAITLAAALRNKKRFNQEAKNRIVVAHSAGMMAVTNAGVIVALNAAEPTLVRQAVRGAVRVGTEPNIEPQTDFVKPTSLSDGFIEIARHPSLLVTVPVRLRSYSTIQTLVEGEAAFPDGRAYLPTEYDEFGFGSHNEVEQALEHGITARMLPGYHNQPLLRPQEGAEHIQWAVNQLTA